MKDFIQLIVEYFKEHIWPFVTINQYEQGVRLRCGKLHKVFDKPGIKWRTWFIDEILQWMVVTTTLNLSEQSVTTKDNKGIVVAAVIKYEVTDIETFLLKVGDQIDALSD